MSDIELYDRQDCPYSKKVREKLEKLGVEYEETVVADRHTEREELAERTGQRGVPCLFDPNASEEFIADSDEIVDHLERAYA